MVQRIDDFQVGPGLALHKLKIRPDLHFLQRRADRPPGVSRENAGGSAFPAQLSYHFGDIDAFSAGVGAHGGDAVDAVYGEGRDLHGFIQGWIQCDSVDHDVTSFVLK